MMMGRIPILITTDSIYPFEDKYDLSSIGIVIDEKDMKNMSEIAFIERIRQYYEQNKLNGQLFNIQKQNRVIWEKYFSPCGFLNNIKY